MGHFNLLLQISGVSDVLGHYSIIGEEQVGITLGHLDPMAAIVDIAIRICAVGVA
jgi:hypothetical protein